MRRLLGVADVIVPNLTEAEFLTGKYQGRESLTAGEARELVDGLLTFGPRSVVVTSGVEGGDRPPCGLGGYNRETGAHFTIPYQFIQVHFPGTGICSPPCWWGSCWPAGVWSRRCAGPWTCWRP